MKFTCWKWSHNSLVDAGSECLCFSLSSTVLCPLLSIILTHSLLTLVIFPPVYNRITIISQHNIFKNRYLSNNIKLTPWNRVVPGEVDKESFMYIIVYMCDNSHHKFYIKDCLWNKNPQWINLSSYYKHIFITTA